jgi:hypothetical protein
MRRYLQEIDVNVGYGRLTREETALAVREHKKTLEELAASYGLPSWYAATSPEEAIAEISAGIACRDTGSTNPQLVEMVRSALFTQVTTENKADRHFYEGLRAFGQGQMAAAARHFDHAIECDPSLYEAGRFAATAKCSLQAWPDVLARCETLLAHGPADPDLRARLQELQSAAKRASGSATKRAH